MALYGTARITACVSATVSSIVEGRAPVSAATSSKVCGPLEFAIRISWPRRLKLAGKRGADVAGPNDAYFHLLSSKNCGSCHP